MTPNGNPHLNVTPEERRQKRSWDFFGYELRKKNKDNSDEEYITSFVPPSEETQSAHVLLNGGGVFATSMDLSGDSFSNESELITKYRNASQQPEVDRAITDIANETIVSNGHDMPVSLNLDKVKGSEGFKDKLHSEFEYILQLLDFRKYGHDIFRRWYVDGRLIYTNVIDMKNPAAGIKELRAINPYKMRKIRELNVKPDVRTGAQLIDNYDEYFVYSEQGFTTQVTSHGADVAQGIKIPADSIVFVTSGILDPSRNATLSYLHKALRNINQLRMAEDALIVYRITRATERRVFNIDTGGLSPNKAQAYVNKMMAKFKNKITYDADTGEVTSDRRQMHINEDFYFPKSSTGKGTTVETIAGGQNLSNIEDIEYFKQQLYKALDVPITRLDNENGFSIGRASEINRDEIRFQKHIDNLRIKFSELFRQILKQQLVLKGIINEDEWDKLKEQIFFDYSKDSFFSELKEAEILRERFQHAAEVEEQVGIYISREYVRKKILKMSDEEIKEEKHRIRTEALYKDGLPDPEGDIEGEGGGGDFQGDLGDEGGDLDDMNFGDPEGAATELGLEGEDNFDDMDMSDDDEDSLDI